MFQPGSIWSGMSEEAVGRQCTSVGASYHERLQIRIPWTECGVELNVGSMTKHRRSIHGTDPAIEWNRLPSVRCNTYPRYLMSASQKAQRSDHTNFLSAQGPLELGTGSRIISTGSTGEIASQYWRSTLPHSISVTSAEARPPCGGLKVGTTSWISDD